MTKCISIAAMALLVFAVPSYAQTPVWQKVDIPDLILDAEKLADSRTMIEVTGIVHFNGPDNSLLWSINGNLVGTSIMTIDTTSVPREQLRAVMECCQTIVGYNPRHVIIHGMVREQYGTANYFWLKYRLLAESIEVPPE